MDTWISDVIKGRVRAKGHDFFVPNTPQSYYTLLYHALVHKPSMHETYRDPLFKVWASEYIPSVL